MSDAEYVTRGQAEMVKSDLQGGTVQYAKVAYDCTVGTFFKRDVYQNGIVPMMLGNIQIKASDLPKFGSELSIGHDMIVMPNTGILRCCKIFEWEQCGPLLDITLHDQNQGA